MVTCEHCGTRQAATTRCLICEQPVPDLVFEVDGFVPFAIDEAEVMARFEDAWALPRRPTPTRCWLRTERWDVRLDAAFEATVQTAEGWALRAGWIDRWFDDVPGPVEGFEALVDAGKQGLGRPDPLPVLAPPTGDAPWLDAAADVIRAATHARAVGELWVDAEPLEIQRRVVLVPIWSIRDGDRVLWVSGTTGALLGERRGNRRRAIGWSIGLGALGLLSLGLAAIVALPGIFLWPLLLVTALGSLAGFGLLVAAGLPFAWVRAATRRTG